MGNNYIGIARESAWGTPVVPDTSFLDFIKEAITFDRGNEFGETAGYIEAIQHSPGKYKANGPIDAYTVPDEIGWLIHMLFGDPVNAGTVETGAWDHTFTPKQDGPHYTIDIAKKGYVRELISCICTKWALRILPATKVYSVFDILASKDKIGADQTPTFTQYPQSLHGTGWVTEIATVDNAYIRSLEYSFERPVDDDDYRRESQFLSEPTKLAHVTTGNMDIQFVDETELKRFYDGSTGTEPADTVTPFALKTTLTGAIISGAVAYELEIDTPNILYNTEASNVDKRNNIVQNVPFRAVYDLSSGYGTQVKLTNRVACYM